MTLNIKTTINLVVYNVNMTEDRHLDDKIDELQNELVLLRFGLLHILDHINETLAEVSKWQRWQGSQAEVDYLIDFRDEIIARYSLSEFIDLCLDLNVNFESLGGEGLSDKARELILFFKRRSQLKELRDYVQLSRPNGRWPNVIP